MGDVRIFLKNLQDTSFNKDLSNEASFGRIHLAGQQVIVRSLYFNEFLVAWRAAEAAAASDRQRHGVLQAFLRHEHAQHHRPAPARPHLRLPGQQGA
jgi:hypothetical protein